jgi:erythromycin esterase-like protein
MSDDTALDVLRHAAARFEITADGFGSLLDAIGDATLVLIGEASHGTHEFYRARAELTKALIDRKGFNVVAVEADWPDAYRANRWVRHAASEPNAEAALGDFTRFPRWMWRNRDVVEFLEWLHDYNGSRDAAARTGFYGLDLYSLHTSIQAVLDIF